MYIDHITRQTFNYAIPISCDNNPEKAEALDPDIDEHYVLTIKPMFWVATTVPEPKRVQSAMCSTIFTAKEAGIHSNGELKNLGNRVVFTKHYDTTLKLLAKRILVDFWWLLTKYLTDFSSITNRNKFSLYKVSRFNFYDRLSNIAPLFTRDRWEFKWKLLFYILASAICHHVLSEVFPVGLNEVQTSRKHNYT